MRRFLRRRLRRIPRIGPVAVAVPGIGNQNHIRPQPPQVGIIQPPIPHHPRREILHHHIADFHQLPEQIPPPRIRQIQSKRLLPPVNQVISRRPVPPILPQIVFRENPRIPPGAGNIRPPRPLHLNHLRPHIRQQPPGVRQRKNISRIQHPDPLQGQPRVRHRRIRHQIASVCRSTAKSCSV